MATEHTGENVVPTTTAQSKSGLYLFPLFGTRQQIGDEENRAANGNTGGGGRNGQSSQEKGGEGKTEGHVVVGRTWPDAVVEIGRMQKKNAETVANGFWWVMFGIALALPVLAVGVVVVGAKGSCSPGGSLGGNLKSLEDSINTLSSVYNKTTAAAGRG